MSKSLQEQLDYAHAEFDRVFEDKSMGLADKAERMKTLLMEIRFLTGLVQNEEDNNRIKVAVFLVIVLIVLFGWVVP